MRGSDALFIWSKRFNGARGWHWRKERGCGLETASAWLRVFRDDEPEVSFVVSRTAPDELGRKRPSPDNTNPKAGAPEHG